MNQPSSAGRRPAGVSSILASCMRRSLDGVPVKVVFSCETCGARPDPETQIALEHQLLDLRHGEYVDADPGNWLTWHGRGIYGRTRYACGTTAASSRPPCARATARWAGIPWAMGPHPWAGRRGSDRARRLARALRSTFGAPGS